MVVHAYHSQHSQHSLGLRQEDPKFEIKLGNSAT